MKRVFNHLTLIKAIKPPSRSSLQTVKEAFYNTTNDEALKEFRQSRNIDKETRYPLEINKL